MIPTLEQQLTALNMIVGALEARETAAYWDDQAARLWVMARTDYQLAVLEDMFTRWDRRYRQEVL